MDWIYTAMNAYEILNYDGPKFFDKHSGLTFTAVNAYEIIGQALSLWHAMI